MQFRIDDIQPDYRDYIFIHVYLAGKTRLLYIFVRVRTFIIFGLTGKHIRVPKLEVFNDLHYGETC